MLRKRLFELGLLVTLLAGLLFNVNLPAQAQDETGTDDEAGTVTVQITGKVESTVTGEVELGDDIIVDGVIIAPAGAFQPSTLEEGDCVTVVGILLNDDTLQAISLEPSEDCDAEDVDDTDGDGVPDADDSCPDVVNLGVDSDGDGTDDACDPDLVDSDDDGIVDADDSCPDVVNLGVDSDGDDIDDACDPDVVDSDGDGIVDADDSCPDDVNLGVDSDDDGTDDACDPDIVPPPTPEPAEGCTTGNHPVLTAYSEEFEVDYAELEAWHCDEHMGMGEIGRALLMAEALLKEDEDAPTYDEILDRRANGENWGALKKEYGIKGNELAPGRVISGHHGEDDEEVTTESTHGNGNQGNNPPGKDKDKDKNKDKGKGNKGGGKKK